MAFLFGFAIGGSALLLFFSLYPGVLPNLSWLALLACPFWFPATCVGGLVFLNPWNAIPDLNKPPLLRRRWVPAAAILLALNGVLLMTGIPRQVAFQLSRSAFDAHVARAPATDSGWQAVDRRLGLYHVETCATDVRGGVYFKTQGGPDGLSARRRTYGFVRRPNRLGSPFGDRDYAHTRVADDWYSFAASTDD